MKEQYARQICLPEVGLKGQIQLSNSRILIVGLGGLGSPIAMYLAAAGVGCLGLVDYDQVELNNLHRQIIHSIKQIDSPKVNSARITLSTLNPETQLIEHHIKITQHNVTQIISGYDVVIAAVDNIESRLVLNEACLEAKIPMVTGGISGWTGVVEAILPDTGSCFACTHSLLSPQKKAKPDGIIGPIAGIVGSWMALEVIKLILKQGRTISNLLLLIDGLWGNVEVLQKTPNTECPTCKNISNY